jgi:hypothetical protein
MKELIMMLSDAMEEKQIINQLHEATEKYRIDPSDKNLTGVKFHCVLMLSKDIVNNEGGLAKAIQNLERQSKIENLTKTTDQ